MANFEPTEHFKNSYADGVRLVAQQMKSKLRGAVLEEQCRGEQHFFEPIGTIEANEVTDRNGDSPNTNVPHLRRRVTIAPAEVGALVDDNDKIRTANDPSSYIPQTQGAAMGRKFDDRIVEALGGTAWTGKEGNTAQPLPNARKIAVNTEGLTFDKVRAAKQLLDDHDVDEDDRFFVIGSHQLNTDMLSIVEATSADYNAVRALVSGRLDTWMGFKWIMLNRLPKKSNVRSCYAFQKTGVGLAIGKEPKSRIVERGDKRFSMYFYYCDMMGATRIEEEKVVEIACQES